jgi:hypothetical protein
VLFFVEEYFALSDFRQSSGFGANPLSQRDVLDRAELVGMVSHNDQLWYLSVMRHLDRVFLDYVREKQKQAEAESKAKANAQRRVR